MRQKSNRGSIRIIAGQWRGRRLPVIDAPGLRPSGDRSRETLFNWLQAYIPGAVCADLFAGTGALGLEAASRGASAVTLVDNHAAVIAYLQSVIELLKAEQVSLHSGDARQWLVNQQKESFDVVFVDPPFEQGQHEAVLQEISQTGILKNGGFVYLETSAGQPAPQTPAGWSCWREKVLGDVRMQVFRSQDGR